MAIMLLFFILFGSLTVMNMLLGVLVEASKLEDDKLQTETVGNANDLAAAILADIHVRHYTMMQTLYYSSSSSLKRISRCDISMQTYAVHNCLHNFTKFYILTLGILLKFHIALGKS